ncbi:putative quinol monooxygenase [Nocardia sp. CA-290969]|uniref:putative quinol monooxygenase n=1 Tax=Nocardia sp. CA-290969 TaxID=3239986 RepID=UPI003D908CCB
MSEIVVVASFTAHQGTEEAAEIFLADLLDTTHAEDGCLLYALHRGVEDPSRFVFVERWESRPLLDAHLNSAHIQTALSRVPEFFSNSDIVYYEAVPGGHSDKGSIAGHARA